MRVRSRTESDPDAGHQPPNRSPTRQNSHDSQESANSALSEEGTDNPAHLFWVPASLHPELAPSEFRAFLKTHTHVDPLAEGEAAGAMAGQGMLAMNGMPIDPDAPIANDMSGMSRGSSWMARKGSLGRGTSSVSGSLNRKRSMLSRQYHPKDGDNVEEEAPPLPTAGGLRRSGTGSSSHRPTSIYGGISGDEGVTLADLQRLEQLADEASDDPAKMRSLLRRSLSINVFQNLEDGEGGDTGQRVNIGSVPGGFDENDVPILVPPPGQILRRTARTKIRKVGLVGDGDGHRFASTRKGRTAVPQRSPSADEAAEFAERHITATKPKDSGDASEDDDDMFSAESVSVAAGAEDSPYHVKLTDQSFEDDIPDKEGRRPSDDSNKQARRLSDGSTGESTDIFDAYADTSESSISSNFTNSTEEASSSDHHLSDPFKQNNVDHQEKDEERTPTGSYSSDLGRASIMGPPPPPLSPGRTIQRVGSQEKLGLHEQPTPQSPSRSYSSLPVADLPSAPVTKAEPPKKEKEKKGGFFSKKDKDKKSESSKSAGKKEKEKDGFLGGLFSSKKKQEEPSAPSKFSEAGRQTAAALLGSSKSAKSLGLVPMSGNSPTSPGFAQFSRYPIHVERAVYRLSHIKLANPRRPLYEQVLISNLMFWYLSVINRVQTPTSPNPSTTDEKSKPAEKGDEPANVKVSGGTPPRPAEEVKAYNARTSPPPARQSQQTPPTPQPEPAPVKRNPLSKPERARGGVTAISSPQYGMQNLQIEKDYPRQPPPPQQQQQQQRPALSPQQQQQRQGPPLQTNHQLPMQQNHQQSSAPPHRQPSSAPNIVQAPSHVGNAPRSPAVPRDQSQAPRLPPIQTQPLMQTMRVVSPPHDQQRAPPSPAGSDRSYNKSYPGGPQRHHEPPVKTNSPQHSGPQPGQVFHYPSNMLNVQPGQVFHHPQHNNGPYPPQQQPPPQQRQAPEHRSLPWSEAGPPPAPHHTQNMRLPPGAAPPRQVMPHQGPNWVQAPLPQGRAPAGPRDRAISSGTIDPYAEDNYQTVNYGARSVSAAASPGVQHHPQNGPGQPYNPYVRQQGPPPTHSQPNGGDPRRYDDPHHPRPLQYPVQTGGYGERR